ncbi:MAG: glycoside hydrolase family 78 protein [Sedimentisphaerales bacterium]|nr:glycoside hydrolase family 78 protein [Sedimentisphaerales bacterium]
MHSWIKILLVAMTSGLASSDIAVYDLRCEYKVNPLGIDRSCPRLSWKIKSSDRNVLQSAYQIQVASSIEDLAADKGLLWDTGKVESDRSIHVPYAGPGPVSRQRVYWRVRVWDNKGNCSDWSQVAWWEMGLLSASDWKANWIEPGYSEQTDRSNPAPMLRRDFVLAGSLKTSRLYITSHGLYQAYINGQPVTEDLFTPGWTSYRKRLQYQTYDVTGLLRPGRNTIGVILGDGWFRGRLMGGKGRNHYGDRLGLLAQLEVTYQDGRVDCLSTDRTWKASTGPILASDIYDGEVYDARLCRPGWCEPDYNDADWTPVRLANYIANLVAPLGPAVRRIEELRPVKIFTTPAGQLVADLGQNMVGWTRIRVRGPAGTKVTLRHFEVLDKKGNVYTENLRSAKQTDTFVLSGDPNGEVFEPHFTYHGFRYVQIEGWPGQPSANDITGVVIHSDIRPTGAFECSDPLVNQLQHNIQWGQKGNFLEVPTDCPQRDERLGWTGDAQVFARTACFNADVAAFYTKWLADLAADQKPNGSVPHVIPDVLSKDQPTGGGAAGWADAAVIVPWTVYICYGDKGILESQYASMKAWVDYMARRAGPSLLWKNDYTFGDWLAYATNRSDYPGATTDKDLICQGYFARSTDILQHTAKILGKDQDAKYYAKLLEGIRSAFQREFVSLNARVASNTQTAYCLALGFGLLPPGQRQQAASRLAADVRQFGHLTTGFLGTPLICQVLTEYGYLDLAYMLLLRKDYPSWLYPVTRGATTIWERWDGIRPDGSFQDPGMNSFNHYAYGAIGHWLYSTVAGIDLDPERPGYKHIIIRPRPGGGLTYAKASLESMYGRIESAWRIDGGQMHLEVVIPPNTTATINLLGAEPKDITESGKGLSEAEGVNVVRQDPSQTIIGVGSGTYHFRYPLPHPSDD